MWQKGVMQIPLKLKKESTQNSAHATHNIHYKFSQNLFLKKNLFHPNLAIFSVPINRFPKRTSKPIFGYAIKIEPFLFFFFFCLCDNWNLGEKRRWVVEKSRLRGSRMLIAGKLPSPRGVLGCWRRLMSSLFSVTLRLPSSSSPSLASSLSSPVLGTSLIFLFDFVFACLDFVRIDLGMAWN